MPEQQPTPPSSDVLLLISTHCVHCKAMLASLGDMVKDGNIASLQIINLEKQPEAAQQYNVRSVPWVRIGLFELEGARSRGELESWIKKANSKEGITEYLEEVLAQGQVEKVVSLIPQHHEIMPVVLDLFDDGDAKINIRLGIGVIMEEYANSDMFKPYISRLVTYTKHDDPRVRSDACHYLSLTEDSTVIAAIEKCLEDDDADVREVAADSIEHLKVFV